MQHRGETLSPGEAADLRALVERLGEREARQRLMISAQTLARAIGRMHVQRSTAAVLRMRLRQIREAA